VRAYIAAPYGARAQARRYSDELANAGITPTCTWVYGSRDLVAGTVHAAPALTDRQADEFAKGDLSEIDEADVLILLTDSAARVEAGGSSSGGRHLETGYALAKRKLVVVVGDVENIFHRSSMVLRTNTWGEAVTLLKELARSTA
jgi:nucleoside 2-deoxyribosyltransferase